MATKKPRALAMPPHPYLQGEDGRYASCDLPRGNRHHTQTAPPTDEVGRRILGEHQEADQ